jgi:hypothetical protein
MLILSVFGELVKEVYHLQLGNISYHPKGQPNRTGVLLG